MDTFLSKLDAGTLIPFTVFVVGLVIAVTALIATSWRRVRQLEIEAALKQDMLQRGMSAEEIERVIQASLISNRRRRDRACESTRERRGVMDRGC